ncbi:FtsX-like permease family protein [Paenibacillus sp. FSL K6-3182]|uniref:FtsX-like permease family protein n=1 Tax=Paenibacillus sp. FSL K6-3182 TaxID=2921495 RepID=UPI0030D59D08
MNIVNLAWANIRKGKSAAFSLFILIFIAALLLNVGMTVIFKINTFFDDKVAELHDPHLNIIMDSASYTNAKGDFLKNYSDVSEFELENMVLMSSAKFRYGDSDMSHAAVILNADTARTIAPLKLIEQIALSSEPDIYLPYSFKVSGGYKLADSFVFTYQDKEYRYRIAGFFETTMLGTTNITLMKYFLPDTEYEQLLGQLSPKEEGTFISAKLKNSEQSIQLLKDYEEQFPFSHNEASSFYSSLDVMTMKGISTMTINLVAMIMVAFAAVIVVVSLLVIKFRVTNSIEDGLVNIGVLKAVGYTSQQIILSIMMQFMIITLLASIMGVAVTYTVMPVFGGIISTLSGLLWNQSFNAVINLASILIVVVLVVTVTLLASIRIRKLHPIAALRGGIVTHNFKKNRFPLDQAKGGLSFVLACKTIVMNIRQNIMITFIVAAVTFASVFAIVLYYNIATDKTAFIHLVGAETSNVNVQAKEDVDSEALFESIKQMDGVEKTVLLDYLIAKVDDKPFAMTISDDYSGLENQMVYEGRYPQYDNEIVVSWAVSQLLEKKIGDTVKVDIGEASHSFLITGLSQSISNMGQISSVTLEGVRHLIPDYTGKMLNVYLNGIDNASFIKNSKVQYGSSVEEFVDVDETINSQSSVYISAVFAVMALVLAITILVVVLILYLVIKTMILKRKRELGIFKATGYTTSQLMTQIMLSFVPIVIIGVVIGGVLGSLYTNSMLTLLLSGAGIHNVQFIIKLPLVIALCFGIVMLSYVVSILVSRRIKGISAYELITE